MGHICEQWGISYLNISLIDVVEIADRIKSVKPHILIASVEKISDSSVQKQLGGLDLKYIAVDEAQASLLVFVLFLPQWMGSYNFCPTSVGFD